MFLRSFYRCAVFFPLITLCSALSIRAQGTLSGRVFLGALADNNVAELPDSRMGVGSTANLVLAYRREGKTERGVNVSQLHVQSANTGYPGSWRDSRTLSHATLRYGMAVSKGFRLQPFVRGEMRQFVDRDINYRTGTLGLEARVNSGTGYFAAIETWRSKVVFNENGAFNNIADVMTLSFGRHFSALEFFNVKAMTSNHQYAKTAISKEQRDMGIKQRDHTFAYGFGAEVFRLKILVQINYLYTIVSSNSYGSSLRMHKFDGMALKKLGRGLFLKLYASTELRDYRDAFIARDVSTYQLGSDNKSVAVEIGKSLSDRHDIKIRLHWYNNQALLRADYYSRTILVAGFESRIGQ